MIQYLVIFEKNKQGHFGAYVPDLPGCVSFGDTIEKAKENIREAIEFHIEGLKMENLPIPKVSSVADTLQIAI